MRSIFFAIGGGMSGSAFLQTTAASAIRKLAVDMDISVADRDQVMSFLSQNSDYAPQSGSIVGILKQMKDTMAADLARITEEEKKAVVDFDGLVAAKEKEIGACQKAIEKKIERIGNLGVDIETMKADLSDTAQDMLEDKKFLEDMDEQCASKKKEWDIRCKTRTEELLARCDAVGLESRSHGTRLHPWNRIGIQKCYRLRKACLVVSMVLAGRRLEKAECWPHSSQRTCQVMLFGFFIPVPVTPQTAGQFKVRLSTTEIAIIGGDLHQETCMCKGQWPC